MRSIKTLALAACAAAAISASAEAQGTRPFRDSWFWGLQTGGLTYATIDAADPTLAVNSSFAPTVGVDWLITRTTGGLYVGFSQAFLNSQSAILNGPSTADSGYRAVEVRNLRRFDMLAMAFPGNYLRFRPYVGAGFSFRYLGTAEALGPFDQQRQIEYAESAVNDAKASFGPAFIAGGQYRLMGVSAFGQVTVSSMSRNFLLGTGRSVSFSTEIGVRYNIGSSIER